MLEAQVLSGSVRVGKSVARTAFVVVSTLAPAIGQAFVDNTTNIPAGAPNNLSDTEQVDFGDIDGDGDLDAVFADGGDNGNDQNRVWLNNGFAQGGSVGFFSDTTSSRFPAVLDQSRDIELIDLDADGDLDIQIANTAQQVNQTSRWWINQGGLQGGSAGFYVDDTAARWVGLSAATCSVASFLVLPGGGFIDFSSDGDFADLDNDGDLDLVNTSVGPVMQGGPTRLFLNNGAGFFEEFNPSGVKLTSYNIATGQLGLWCQGQQQQNTTDASGAFCDVSLTSIDSDVADSDSDFDLDLLGGDRANRVRVFRNALAQSGALGFRDVTSAVLASNLATVNGKYEQEWGDLDNDSDVDIYGVNWSGPFYSDQHVTNTGVGVYVLQATPAASGADEEEADFLDYDGDGDLDVMLANFSGRDQLYRNSLSGGVATLTIVTSTDMPNLSLISRDVDTADLDQDGDCDAMIANGSGDRRNAYYVNTTQIPDTHAPRIPALEQVSNAPSGPNPIAVRAHVFDNQADYITRFNATTLEHRVNGGAWVATPMVHSGGQVYRGELPPNLSGSVEYRVRSIDAQGNVGLSASRTFARSYSPTSYCTAGTSSGGCVATLSSSGAPSLGAASGFTLSVTGADGQRQGLVFYGVSGRLASSFPPGGAGFLCVKLPVQRMAVANTGGTNALCNGALQYDWLSYLAANPGALGTPFGAGATVNAQAWLRDANSPGGSILSQGLEFVTLP